MLTFTLASLALTAGIPKPTDDTSNSGDADTAADAGDTTDTTETGDPDDSSTYYEEAPFLMEPWAERVDERILCGAQWDDDQGDFAGGFLMITIDVEDEAPFEVAFEVKTDWAVDGAEALLGASDITFVLTGFDPPNDVALEFHGVDVAGNSGNTVRVVAKY